MWDDNEARVSNAMVEGRDANMANIKPGCGTIFLVFSDQMAEHAYRFPYYEYFRDVLEPLILEILGPGGLTRVVRMQFARMPPGGVIHLHPDGGGFAHKAHRIHVPIFTNPNVSFQICPKLVQRCKEQGLPLGEHRITETSDCVEVPMEEGIVSEINNVVAHRVLNNGDEARFHLVPDAKESSFLQVLNNGDEARIHLVLDAKESSLPTVRLQPGTRCDYTNGLVLCPEGTVVEDVVQGDDEEDG
eukprot:gene30168-35148_t